MTDLKGRQLVDYLIKNRKVFMVSKKYCPFCVKAKKALANYKIDEYEVLEIAGRSDMDEIQVSQSPKLSKFLQAEKGPSTTVTAAIDGPISIVSGSDL